MNYYIIKFETNHFTEEKFFDLNLIPFQNSDTIAPFFFISKKLELPKVELIFSPNFNHIMERDYLSNDKSWPVFSKAFVNILNEFDNTCNKYPAIIKKNENTFIKDKFFVVQPPIIAGMVDMKNSKFEPHPLKKNRIYNVENLALKTGNNQEPLFRIEEYPNLLFSGEHFKAKLENRNLKGILIIPLEENSWL